MRVVKGPLEESIRSYQDDYDKEDRILSGRQISRIIWNWHQTDAESTAMFNVTHLRELAYKGDAHLESFLIAWRRLLRGQEEAISEKNKQRIFEKKIEHSQVLKPYLDHYNRIDKTHGDYCYKCLIDSADKYVARLREKGNTAKLATHMSEYAKRGGDSGLQELRRPSFWRLRLTT